MGPDSELGTGPKHRRKALCAWNLSRRRAGCSGTGHQSLHLMVAFPPSQRSQRDPPTGPPPQGRSAAVFSPTWMHLDSEFPSFPPPPTALWEGALLPTLQWITVGAGGLPPGRGAQDKQRSRAVGPDLEKQIVTIKRKGCVAKQHGAWPRVLLGAVLMPGSCSLPMSPTGLLGLGPAGPGWNANLPVRGGCGRQLVGLLTAPRAGLSPQSHTSRG